MISTYLDTYVVIMNYDIHWDTWKLNIFMGNRYVFVIVTKNPLPPGPQPTCQNVGPVRVKETG